MDMLRSTRRKVTFISLLWVALAFPVLWGLPGLSAPADKETSSNTYPAEWAERDEWQRPEEVMNDLRLRAGSQVADVGCGEGYFTYHLAERVGPQGRVYAEDIQPELIRALWHQALNRWLVQVRPVLGEEDNPHLPRQRLDAVLLVHSYHEMHPHAALVKAFYRALRPGGLLGIIEYAAPDNMPREESYTRHQIPPHTVREEITAEGFEFVSRRPDFHVPNRSWGRDQYFLLFEKPEE